MPIVKYKNQSGVTYAYEQTSVYDAEKKQSRPVRKYLGKVDPETGEIISTQGKRGRPPKQSGSDDNKGSEKDYKSLFQEQCQLLEKAQNELSMAIAEKETIARQNSELRQILESIRMQIDMIVSKH